MLDILAIVVGERLDPRSDIVDALGIGLGVDMTAVWQADAAFVDALRDREVLLGMIGDVAGPAVADANAREPVRTLRTILRDCIDGTGGRTKAEGWVPRWLTFPSTAYTARGGVGSVARSAKALAALTPVAEWDESEPKSSEPQGGSRRAAFDRGHRRRASRSSQRRRVTVRAGGGASVTGLWSPNSGVRS